MSLACHFSMDAFSSYTHWEEEWHHDTTNYEREYDENALDELELELELDDPMTEDAPDPEPVWATLPRGTSAPLLFAQSAATFALLFQRAVHRHRVRHGASSPTLEAAFLVPLRRPFRLLVSALHSARHRGKWLQDARAATTIRDFAGVVSALLGAMDGGVFAREFYQMSSTYEGVDKTIHRYGY
jgi:hypothetical protein